MNELEQKKDLELYDQWAASYALTVGCILVKVVQNPDSVYTSYVFDDSAGRASRALGEWRTGNTLVRTKEFIKAYKQIKNWSRRQPAQMMNEVVTNGTKAI